MWLRLLSAGYKPYTEVYITYPPLYPLAIQTIWNWWPTEEAQRWFSVLYTLFGGVGVALMARQWAGKLAGLIAAALTLFSPILVEPSRAVLAEFPSVAWSVWAVWLACLGSQRSSESANGRTGESTNQRISGDSRRRILLVLSGLCLSASLLTKLLSPFMLMLIPLILITPHALPLTLSTGSVQNFRQILRRVGTTLAVAQPGQTQGLPLPEISDAPLSTVRFPPLKSLLPDLAAWSLAVILPALLLLSVFNIEALARQVVEQRLQARTASLEEQSFWPPRYERGLMFVQEDRVLAVMGLVGLGLAWWNRQRQRWLILAWLILALLMLAIHNPIRYKHFLILIPPLAILGGAAIAKWIYDLPFFHTLQPSNLPPSTLQPPYAPRPTPHALLMAVIGLLLSAGLIAWQIPITLESWQAKAAVPQPPEDETQALAFIEAVTAPNDCLISDDMPLSYWSGRLSPPELAEVSTNRLDSGALTTPQLIAVTDQYDCQVVAAVSNRITKYLPDYMEWVKQKYLGRFHYGEDILYFAKLDTDPRPAVSLQADFAGQLKLLGYTLPASSTLRGVRIPLTLIWQAQTQPFADYAIFVQLRDAANTVLANADYQPYQGLLPTSTWPAGAVIHSVTWLQLPTDISPGSYNLYVGVYHPDNLERLPLQGDTSGENALVMEPISIQ